MLYEHQSWKYLENNLLLLAEDIKGQLGALWIFLIPKHHRLLLHTHKALYYLKQ